MPEEITPQQQTQLRTWAEQRDQILGEISANRVINEGILKSNIDLSESNGALVKNINESTGRLAQLKQQEDERATLISKDIFELQLKKTELETLITRFVKDIEELTSRKKDLTETMKTLIELHGKVFNRASVLDQVVDHVTRVNGENINDVNTMLKELHEYVLKITGELSTLHQNVTHRAKDLNSTVEHAIELNTTNTQQVATLISDLKDKLT